MRKIFYCVLVTMSVIITSCSSSRNVSADNVIKNSMWVNLTKTTMDNEEGVLITGLYFSDDNKVIMKTGVGQGSEVIATPIFSNYGTYTYSGNLKKGIRFNINTDIATIGKKVNYEGLITPDGMILIEPDSTAYFYYQLKTTHK